jgi:hypothetical protein
MHGSIGEAATIIATLSPSAVFLVESKGGVVWLRAYDNSQPANILPYAIECTVSAALVF